MSPKKNSLRSGLSSRISALGFNAGYHNGYNKGYQDGFHKGCEARSDRLTPSFEGTSIIIPTYNQKDFLKECLESIQTYTSESYELIIIDNGSTDGSVEYLKSLAGRVRLKAMGENLGFAGAVNQGLVMARGTTLLILNNDTVMTNHWLSNLLTCVHSSPLVGIAGPVTNYISGEQLIDTAYDSISGMHEFASAYNRSDSGLWVETDRLTGFCMLMRREVFQRLGYLDEGFEIGNCEDDDYGLRLRLLGLKLIIARDIFIHHYGSVSMKALQTRFDQVYEKNMMFYINKWGEPHLLLAGRVYDGEVLRMTDFYPNHVNVRGLGSAFYWVEQGIRYPVEALNAVQAVRLSEVDLHNWPLGETITRDEWLRKQEALNTLPLEDELSEGCLAETPDNHIYRFDQGRLRRVINDYTRNAWMLTEQPVKPIRWDAKNQYPEGNPIIAPPVLKAGNL